MFTVYMAFLSFGVLLALGSLLLGQLGGDGSDAGHGVDAGADTAAGVDAGGGAEAGAHGHGVDSHAHAGGHINFPFFSPGVLGSFAAAFGAGGIIALESGATSLVLNLPVALGSGVGLAYAKSSRKSRRAASAKCSSRRAARARISRRGPRMAEPSPKAPSRPFLKRSGPRSMSMSHARSARATKNAKRSNFLNLLSR
ncbi:MAG: hypothetical protein HYY84_05905 [Deltaproteobacteria bacterium]|nr:hypothetical protein [Deltaproteobacteria bacterium]